MPSMITGVELTDPMSGYFMLRTETLRADAHRLSGVGFKILLDILATVDTPLRVKEFPLDFAARASGESKLDRTIVFEFLVGLYDRWLGRIIPTRFALFGTIGAAGVLVVAPARVGAPGAIHLRRVCSSSARLSGLDM